MDVDCELDDNSDCDCDSESSGVIAYRRLEAPAYHTSSVRPRPSLKYVDCGIGGTGVTTFAVTNIGVTGSYSAQLISGIINTRFVGNQVTNRSFSWNFIPVIPTAGTAPNALKVSFVWDRQPNGALASYSDIYVTGGTGSVLNPFRHQNPDNLERFVILKTFVYPCPLNGGVNFETGKIPIDMVSTFINGQATTVSPISGNLIVAAVCSSANVGVILYGFCRIRYYDN